MKDLKNITAEDLTMPDELSIKAHSEKELTKVETFIWENEIESYGSYDRLAAALSEVAREAARQEAIGFAEWLGNNYSPTKVVYAWKKDGGIFTTKELYDQYLLHLEQLKQEKK